MPNRLVVWTDPLAPISGAIIPCAHTDINSTLTLFALDLWQEKLLISVLPRFVALEIISDIANQDESRILPTQFHKIYIHCYKDVR